MAFGKPAIVKRKNVDSYNLQYAVWNNKISKDGEPQGAGHQDGSTSCLLKFEHFFNRPHKHDFGEDFLLFNSLNLTEVTVGRDPLGIKFCSPYSLEQSYQDPPQL